MDDVVEAAALDRAAHAVIAELCGRKGFAGWWGDIDVRTREEILRDLRSRIEVALVGRTSG
jgi:DNA-binding GntR family transcriptional regulator